MNGHFIENCMECGTVIIQCKCIRKDREQRWGICKQCRPISKLPRYGYHYPGGDPQGGAGEREFSQVGGGEYVKYADADAAMKVLESQIAHLVEKCEGAQAGDLDVGSSLNPWLSEAVIYQQSLEFAKKKVK